ncbi:orotate phosphoribosyltransferase [Legionella impletisoli]|uniref:Orotate phosphoribosyltransferase n=1 Tax=Legionella impletisoli TaxID=343510 RepID=A0A917JQ19_9GAMM|nr:orotate phosphoribosyltransferase [Legionella impletisoli]GGI81256.1 orotate phosphoribosyltransferase [Legionella impletisoli]
MNNLKEAFIRLALECEALKFGEFTLKSGRKSPYFFNAGLIYQGKGLRSLGQFYANAIFEQELDFDHIFGPSYKGIPIATATAIALAEMGVDTTVTFNRKEIKTHGEGGQLIGAPLSGKTLVVDDVITAGTAFREAQDLIIRHGGTLSGVVISLDRCERGQGEQSTLREIKSQGIEVISLITIFDLIDYLQEHAEEAKVSQLKSYLEIHGESL